MKEKPSPSTPNWRRIAISLALHPNYVLAVALECFGLIYICVQLLFMAGWTDIDETAIGIAKMAAAMALVWACSRYTQDPAQPKEGSDEV